ncbi:MAG: hypothetical protein JJ959_02845 [Nisaea sp.]|uniref:hypothetical protein n=1 Tax=Nisaea sp. TaxID=2024842 RepID=UPI001B1760FA|nr:hypothetical protein [Nisaea sp.]MBO6559441.1 hypothetical protein [Nisaea sp.]
MTSFAKTVSATRIDAPSSRESFDAARQEAVPKVEGPGSEMIAKDKPHPAPRPSPGMAVESDRAAFNTAWEREQRRAAFIAMRTDPETGARVRVLNKTFNR